MQTVDTFNDNRAGMEQITLPCLADDQMVRNLVDKATR
jgi:hypothetical protein